MSKYLVGIVLSIFCLNAFGDDCDWLNAKAQDESETISSRLDAAKQYRTCIANENANGAQALFLFKSTPMAVDAEEQVQSLEGKKSFLGQNFGVGFGVSFYDDEIVDDADVVNGIVVAKSKKREEARVLLEFHTLIACKNGKADFGCGPFAAIAAKNNDILGGVGLGWLWSWRNKAKTDGSGFSIGIGAIVDNDVRDLADGFKVGEALPDGETAVRYTDETKASYLLFISNTF